MYRRYLPTPKQAEKDGVSMHCPICNEGGYYRFEDVVRHPGWCPGRPAAGADGAGVGEGRRPGEVALEQPRQYDDRALLRAAERDRRVIDRGQALGGPRDLAAEQPRHDDDRAALRAAERERDRRVIALRGLRDIAAEQQRRLIPVAVLELRTACASASGKATASPAGASTSPFPPSTPTTPMTSPGFSSESDASSSDDDSSASLSLDCA